MFTYFKDAKPKQITPLIVELENGTICNAYYVAWSNYVYLECGIGNIQAIKWSYKNKTK